MKVRPRGRAVEMTLPGQNRLAPGYPARAEVVEDVRLRVAGELPAELFPDRTRRVSVVPALAVRVVLLDRRPDPRVERDRLKGSRARTTARSQQPCRRRRRTSSATRGPLRTGEVRRLSRIRLTRCDHLCGPLHVGSAVPEREVAKLRLGPRRELVRRRKCAVLLTVDRYGVAIRLPQTALHPVNPRDAHLCRANKRYQTRKDRVAREAHPLVRVVRPLEEGKIRGCIENRIEVVIEPE